MRLLRQKADLGHVEQGCVVCRSTQGGLVNVLGALYATTLFFSIINATVIQPVISAERAVSYRERAAGMYSVLPWTLALVTALCPMSFCNSCMLLVLNGLTALHLVYKLCKEMASAGVVVCDRLQLFLLA